MYQDNLIYKIEKIFGESAAKMQIYGVPGGTGENKVTRRWGTNH